MSANARTNAFSTSDTIVAVATPPGRGAVGVARLSGPEAISVAYSILESRDRLEDRRATLGRCRPHGGWPGDEVVATLFAGPRSYTGEDVVEISAHGSPVVMRAIVDAACHAGARLARPGEFTLRAYLNGKRDLVQAEAVADLIEAVTPLQARLAFDQLLGTLTTRIKEIDAALFAVIARLEASLDFPDEGYHFVNDEDDLRVLKRIVGDVERLVGTGRQGRVVREGAHVVLAGRPNTGKSLLFNKLIGHERAIVTGVAGTTRDLLAETIDIEGIPVRLVDTAGIRNSEDEIEAEGVRRAERARDVADVVVLVLDRSETLEAEDLWLLEGATPHHLLVANKCDLPPAFENLPNAAPFVGVSAKTGEGIRELREAISARLLGGDQLKDTVCVSNARHLALMEEALERLRAAAIAMGERTPEEFVLTDLQAARRCFDEVVGARTSDDVLRHVFERFCIGK